MKILILQTAGEHEENVNFRECLCIQRALSRIAPEIETTVVGPGHKVTSIGRRKADVIFCVENYSRKPWIDIAASSALKVFWCIDAHVAGARHKAFADEQKFNIVLQSTRRFVAEFSKPGRKVLWFPNAYPSDLIKPIPNALKTCDVGFCGSMLNRAPMLKQMRGAFPDFRHDTVLGDAMVSAINGYRVHWNHSYGGDINYRVFETAGCATALVTDRVDGISELFPEGEISTYTTMAEAADQVRWWIDHPGRREASAWAAHARAEREHSYDARMRQFLEVIK